MIGELHIDAETRNPSLNLKKVGVWHYLSASSTSVSCVAFASRNGPARSWTPGKACPAVIRRAVAEAWTIHSFGAFDRLCWEMILGPRYGWPVPTLAQWSCVQSQALYMALPASLERLAGALGLAGKDEAGRRLMLQLAKADAAPGLEDLAALCRYCERDVALEREIAQLLPPLPAAERELWLLSEKINDRGFHIDLELALGARAIVSQARPALDAAMARATGGAVTGVQQTARLRTWLEAQP